MDDIVELLPEDLPLVEQLLQSNGLPFEDCHQHIHNFVGIFDGSELVAVGGLEKLNRTGLLRSIAVKSDLRSRGIGNRLVKHLEQRAIKIGIENLYLLTETAETYFKSLGYKTIDRTRLPVDITQTQQFQCLCPESAQALFIHLAAEQS